MIDISLAGAFLGGVLSLLSPCSALLLPAFFAYAFQSRTQLFVRTGVFYLGLLTFFVPLGLGAGYIGQFLAGNREIVITVAGVILVLFGLVELAGKGFSLIPQSWTPQGTGSNWLSVYSIGVFYGLAGFCAGPLLGAVLTMAAGTANPLHAGVLLAVFALGTAIPLFFIAALWDRFQLGRKQWLRGRTISLFGWRVHSIHLASGLLFIGLGLVFILTGGTSALEGVYGSAGLVDLSFRVQSSIAAWGDVLTSVVAVAILGTVLLLVIGRRQRR